MKLIQTNTHLLFIDETADFDKTHYYWDNAQKTLRHGSNNHVTGGYKQKVIASLPEIKGLPLLPPFEEDFAKLALVEHQKKRPGSAEYLTGYYEGYKTAQSHSKQYSLEDIEKAFQAGLEYGDANCETGGNTRLPNKYQYIESLFTPKVPKEFIPEYEEYSFDEFEKLEENEFTEKISDEYYKYSNGDESFEHWFYANLKWINTFLNKGLKITNSEGKQQLVGTYKY